MGGSGDDPCRTSQCGDCAACLTQHARLVKIGTGHAMQCMVFIFYMNPGGKERDLSYTTHPLSQYLKFTLCEKMET
jgi:hypothetical protein